MGGKGVAVFTFELVGVRFGELDLSGHLQRLIRGRESALGFAVESDDEAHETFFGAERVALDLLRKVDRAFDFSVALDGQSLALLDGAFADHDHLPARAIQLDVEVRDFGLLEEEGLLLPTAGLLHATLLLLERNLFGLLLLLLSGLLAAEIETSQRFGGRWNRLGCPGLRRGWRGGFGVGVSAADDDRGRGQAGGQAQDNATIRSVHETRRCNGRATWHMRCSLVLSSMPFVKIIPLGTSSGVPTRFRHVSSVAMIMDSRWVLFDCGEGTQYQVMRAGLSLNKLDAVLITHLHGDHVLGLPGMLSSLSMQNRNAPLSIHGPEGIHELLTTVGRLTETRFTYPLQIEEIRGDGLVRKTPHYSVECARLDHRVTAYGYAVRNVFRSGTPGEVEFRVAYCTDTRPCAASVELAREADLVIHEATYLHELVEKAHERGHATAADAAGIAREARAKRLLLTHFSARYRDVQPLVEEAQGIFPNVTAAADLVPVELYKSSRLREPFSRDGEKLAG